MIPQRAGLLNRRISLERRNETDDDVGEPIPEWEEYARVWAHFAPQFGSEQVTEGQTHATRTTNIMIRNRVNVQASDRVVYQGVVYNIQAIIERDRYRDELMLVVSDGANAG